MKWRLWQGKKDKYTLLVLLLLGLILRIWGIRQDLPYNYYGDETYLIYNSLKFGTGDLNPHWFIWPTFFQYILFFFFAIFYAIGHILNWFKNITDFLYLYLKDPSIFFLIGRTASAIFGTASIFLLYLLAKKPYNKNNGLIPAAIFTFLPLSVEYSHYSVVDTPLVFMITLSCLFIINVFLYARLRDYLLSGIFSGLAIGTKYTAVFLVLPIFLAHLFGPKSRSSKNIFNLQIVLSFLFILLGFLLACPFAALDFPKFFSDMRTEFFCSRIGWFGWEQTNPYTMHLTENLKNAIGLPLLAFSLISLIYVLIRRNKIDLILLSFPAVYFLCIGWGKNPYYRFMLPVLPFLVIFSGRLLSDLKTILYERYEWKGFLLFSLLWLSLLVNPVYASIRTDYKFYLPNTMTLAKEWIEENIASGSKILLNEYGPPLIQSPGLIKAEVQNKPRKLLCYGYQNERELFYNIKEKIAKETKNYELTYICNPIGYLENDVGYNWLMAKTEEAIRDYQNKYDFIIISGALLNKFLGYPKESIPARYWGLRDFYKDMLNNYQPIKVFTPEPNISKGPNIKIFKMK